MSDDSTGDPFCLETEDDFSEITDYMDAYHISLYRIQKSDSKVTFEHFIQEVRELSEYFLEQLHRIAIQYNSVHILKDFLRTSFDEANLKNADSRKNRNEKLQNAIKWRDELEHVMSMSTLSMSRHDCIRIPQVAIEHNRLDILKLCVRTGVDLNQFRNMAGSTLLEIAISMKDVDMTVIESLIDHVDVNIASSKGHVPLNSCLGNRGISCERKLALVKLLLATGADVDYSGQYKTSALNEYCFSLFETEGEYKLKVVKDIIDTLLSSGANINETDWRGKTALMIAVEIMRPSNTDGVDQLPIVGLQTGVIRHLLERGADPNIGDSGNRTCAHIALASQNIDILQMLMEYKCKPNVLSHGKMTPIYSLCVYSEWDEQEDIEYLFRPMLMILIKAGCDLNIQAIDSSTVLHYAAACTCPEICELLLKHGSNVATQDYLQRTPLHYASRNTNRITSATLIRFGASVNVADIHKETPLHIACLYENTAVIQVLVDSGANVSAPSDVGAQCIHLAAENGDVAMIEYLLSAGADINALDVYGATPLHYGASDNNWEVVQYLLSLGVDKHHRDTEGHTALDLAIYRGQYKSAMLLSDAGSGVRFGNMPEGLFPNRPLLKIEEVDNYFDNLEHNMQNIVTDDNGLDKIILQTPGLGKVSLQHGEAKIISDRINNIAEMIAERIGKIDPVFKGSLLKAGSTCEKVKIGYPDEFDFVYHVENLSSYIETCGAFDLHSFAKITMKAETPSEISKFCVRDGRHLNAAAIIRHFYRLLRLATYDVLKIGIENVFYGHLLLPVCIDVFSDTVIPLVNLVGSTVSWRGSLHKLLNISIDFNPVVFSPTWPKDGISECMALGNLDEMGIFFIPKHSKRHLALSDGHVPMSCDLWRYSTHHVESAIFNSLPEEVRDSFMLCKTLRMEPLTCSVELERPDAFYSVAELRMLQSFDEDEDKQEEDIDDTDDENGNGYVSGVLNTSDSAFNDTAVMNSGGERYGTAYVEQEEDFEIQDEVTAEKLIPSYYLKSLFIKEVDRLLKESGPLSQSSLKMMPLTVYRKLLESIQNQSLETLFFPEHNIYSDPGGWTYRKRETKKLREQYSKRILQIIEKCSPSCYHDE